MEKPVMTDEQIAALRATLAAMSDAELRKFAEGHSVDAGGATSRDEVEAAIETATVRRAEEAAKGKPPKQPVKSGGNAKRGQRAIGDPLTDEQVEAVQKVWIWWSRNIPLSAHSSGVWQIDADSRKDAKDHGVPNGDYRVIGADWIMSFRGGRFVEAVRAAADTRADSYATVPGPTAKL